MYSLQGEQFAVEEVEVVTATVDLDEVVSWRGKNSSLREQASSAPRHDATSRRKTLIPTSSPHVHQTLPAQAAARPP